MLTTVVLAAGEGTRMHSSRPKPLHRLCGRPMVLHILDGLAELDPARTVVVVGHGAEDVTKELIGGAPANLDVDVAEQVVRRGTGHALMAALPALADPALDGHDHDDLDVVLVVPGDAPLLRVATLAGLIDTHCRSGAAATLLSARPDNPFGYGRVVRGRDGAVTCIVEQADATPEEQAIDEVATSIYCFRHSLLAPALRRIRPDNHKGEYYLTDVVDVLASTGHLVASVVVDDARETQGVNDRAQLAMAEAELRRRINGRWMASGVGMVDPTQTYIDVGVRVGADASLLPGTVLSGTTVVGEGAIIGPGTHLVDCVVGPGATVAQSSGIGAEIGAGARVGPFVRLGPGSVVPADGLVPVST